MTVLNNRQKNQPVSAKRIHRFPLFPTPSSAVAKALQMSFLTLSLSALLFCAGCPKNGSHTPSENRNGDQGHNNSGHHGANGKSAQNLVIPNTVPKILAFGQKHSKCVDSVDKQKAVLAAIKKGLQKEPKNTKLILLGCKAACRLGILSDTQELMGNYGAQVMKWGKIGMALQPNKVVFFYYTAMGMAMKLQASSKQALDKLPHVVKLAKKAIKLDEKYDYAGPLRFLGALYVEAPEMGSVGDKEKGIELLKKSVAHFPDYPINRFYLGQAYYKDEQYEKAQKELKKVINAKDDAPWSPRDRDHYQKKAKSYLKLIKRKLNAGFGV